MTVEQSGDRAVLFVGDDWAEDHHDIEVQDEHGRPVRTARLPEGMDGMARFHELVATFLPDDADPSRVLVCIEVDRGPWVRALVAAGYQVFGVNPKQAARHREVVSMSGAKSDKADAHVLADMVRTRRHQLRQVAADSDIAEAVKVVARAHQTLIWERTRHMLRLRSALRDYFPAALQAYTHGPLSLTDADVLELLARAPEPAAAARLTLVQISAALKRKGRRDVPGKAAAIRDALRTEHLGQAPIVAGAYAATVTATVAVLQVLNAQIAALESQVEAHFGQHPDAETYLSQPGIGVVLGARVLAEFGDAPRRYADAKSRKNYAGTSPITRQSGKARTVHARFVHNDRLVDALHMQASAALLHDHHVRAYYDELRARGTSHNTALRQVGKPPRRHPPRLPQNQHPPRPTDRLVTPHPTPRSLTPKLQGCLTYERLGAHFAAGDTVLPPPPVTWDVRLSRSAMDLAEITKRGCPAGWLMGPGPRVTGDRTMMAPICRRSMTFQSILFDRGHDGAGAAVSQAPVVFEDLNLDQVVESITAGREEYDLAPFFYAPLRSVESIAYRHEILRDLDGKVALDDVRSFAKGMRSAREQLTQSQKLYSYYQKERWFLSAVETYCGAVNELADALAEADLKSRGLLAFRKHLSGYVRSDAFQLLVGETAGLTADLLTVRYCLRIGGSRITVSRYDAETDYSAEIEHTFERFKQGAAKDYRIGFGSPRDLNHVEAGILERVAKLYPDMFSALDDYCDRHADFIDKVIATFDREVQFYVAYLEYVEPFKAAGLEFCYPAVSDAKDILATGTFDLALANTLIPAGSPVVCNDFYLTGQERIFVVTGPNQGGKTTFARTFGQLHFLASLGCPVPGADARLHLFDRMFTHFEKEEDLKDLRGKLQDDLIRIHEILEQATSDSIIIMNEIFTSTTLQDAVLLGKRVMAQVIDLGLLCVCVTFVDELASLSETSVSMVSTVDPADLASRTYKIVRRPADGLAYAAAIAEKYQLSYELLKGRLTR